MDNVGRDCDCDNDDAKDSYLGGAWNAESDGNKKPLFIHQRRLPSFPTQGDGRSDGRGLVDQFVTLHNIWGSGEIVLFRSWLCSIVGGRVADCAWKARRPAKGGNDGMCHGIGKRIYL